ncbi:hypothetical protein D9M69_724200 [compost metagenome]
MSFQKDAFRRQATTVKAARNNITHTPTRTRLFWAGSAIHCRYATRSPTFWSYSAALRVPALTGAQPLTRSTSWPWLMTFSTTGRCSPWSSHKGLGMPMLGKARLFQPVGLVSSR